MRTSLTISPDIVACCAHAAILIAAGYAWLKYRGSEVTLNAIAEAASKSDASAACKKMAWDLTCVPGAHKEYVQQLEHLMNLLAYVGISVSIAALLGWSEPRRTGPMRGLGVIRWLGLQKEKVHVITRSVSSSFPTVPAAAL
jgi:hypothetical protein